MNTGVSGELSVTEGSRALSRQGQLRIARQFIAGDRLTQIIKSRRDDWKIKDIFSHPSQNWACQIRQWFPNNGWQIWKEQ